MGRRNTDILGDPYTVETITLADDIEGPVEATLVHRPSAEDTTRAVLHVHGFADYFFHTEYAEWWTTQGYDFYALDLRKYGRSLRAHHTPAYAADLREYFEELDEAWTRITQRDGHRDIVLSAHSTGGLTTSLWVDSRQPALAGLMLNSPWLDMSGPWWFRLGTGVVRQLGSLAPRQELPRPVTTYYGRSLHRDHDGEWPYNLSWKPLLSWPVYAGWLRAIGEGQAEVQAGLSIECPILVLSSATTLRPTVMSDEVHRHDIVLDVTEMRRWAPRLGPHVTLVSIPGARHDVVLSLPHVRARAYDEIRRWLAAYIIDPSS